MNLTRLEAFSDGVFSIAATLLVLEFKVPELHGVPYPAALLIAAAVAFAAPAVSVAIYIISPIAYLLPNAVEWTLTRDRS